MIYLWHIDGHLVGRYYPDERHLVLLEISQSPLTLYLQNMKTSSTDYRPQYEAMNGDEVISFNNYRDVNYFLNNGAKEMVRFKDVETGKIINPAAWGLSPKSDHNVVTREMVRRGYSVSGRTEFITVNGMKRHVLPIKRVAQ